MRELSIYDTRTVEVDEFEPWMVGRPVCVTVEYPDRGTWGTKFHGVVEYFNVDASAWYLKLENRDEQTIPVVRDDRTRTLSFSVVVPASYVHISSDGSRIGGSEDEF